MKNFYLVTGGTGFIGSSLVKKLVKDGYKVRVLDNNLRGANRRLSDVIEKIEMVEGDIRDPQTVDKACKGVSGVIHLAYLNGTEFFYSKPELVLDIGVKGMTNIIDSCIKHKISDLILASSSEVYQQPPNIPTSENAPLVVPDPLNPRYSYGGGKIISELMAINYGRKYLKRVAIFRPHNVYGPDMGEEHVIPQFIIRMKNMPLMRGWAKFPIQGTGKETRSFIYIDDFIEGLMLIIKKGKHLNIYNIGTMDELPIEEIAYEVAHYFGKKIKISQGTLTKGSVMRRCPDISKLKSLGFAPKISIQEGIRKTANWYAKQL